MKENNALMEHVQVKVTDTQPCSVTMTVEVAQPEVARETERVYREMQKVAQVPGFRPGKAPMDLVKKNYAGKAREKVIESLIQNTVFSSLHSQSIEPVDYPKIQDLQFDFEKPFIYTLKAERHPEFTVKDYKGIKIKKEVREITDAKVAETIDTIRDRNARLEASKNDAVRDTDFVLADYEGFVDGQSVPELKASNQLVDLSSPQSLAGFKEGLVGAKKGETREIKVPFPAEAPNKQLAGKDVIFKVTVNDIKEKVLPALDDEFAKDVGTASLDELRAKVRESLESEEKKRQDQEVEKQVTDHLLNANTFPVPESLVEEQLKHLLERMFNYFRRQGIPDETIAKNTDEWRKKYRAEAERNVRLSYILSAVGDAEKITVTEDDLHKEHETLHAANPERDKEVEEYFAEHKNTISSRLKEEKIFKFLLDNAKVKEEKK